MIEISRGPLLQHMCVLDVGHYPAPAPAISHCNFCTEAQLEEALTWFKAKLIQPSFHSTVAKCMLCSNSLCDSWLAKPTQGFSSTGTCINYNAQYMDDVLALCS